MEGFKVTLINEIEKLYKKKKVLIAVLLSLVFVIGWQLIMIGLRGFGMRGSVSLSFPVEVLTVVINILIPLFTALITIDAFSGEFSHNTMKVTLTRPVTRFKVYAAKISSVFIFIFAILALVLVFSLFVGIIFNRNSSSWLDFLRVVVIYIASGLPVMVLTLLIALLANIIRSGIAVFFTSIMLYLALYVLGIVFSRYSSLFFTSTFDWYSLWLADSIPFSKVIRQFILLTGLGTMLFTAGFYRFDKKEF